ncbi:MAG: hypothetical protein L3J24_03190 [Xanthomonadales bacterium]|nr:hypothetical protein [Xanthomonadales bacterium]
MLLVRHQLTLVLQEHFSQQLGKAVAIIPLRGSLLVLLGKARVQLVQREDINPMLVAVAAYPHRQGSLLL